MSKSTRTLFAAPKSIRTLFVTPKSTRPLFVTPHVARTLFVIPQAALTLFVIAAAVELIGVATDIQSLQWIAKPLLAPLLIWFVLTNHGGRLLVAALAFATAGDIALLIPGQLWFLLGMAAFLGTQIALTIAFVSQRRPKIWTVVGYVTLWAAVNAALWSQLGALRVPILVYSVALTAMACAATAVSARTGAGGTLFLLSDLLIGVGAANMDFPGRDLVVMSTYAAALYLITTGSAVNARAGEADTSEADTSEADGPAPPAHHCSARPSGSRHPAQPASPETAPQSGPNRNPARPARPSDHHADTAR
ncbi:lysoplasmalogenase [Dactylosporangium sp. NPDC051541]|uniref:lysoplasmalogenase n=1 Tax=Dactylosporangium sp. NPDC051541 TaxID=3363977 RepID=UPI00378BCE6B